MLYQLQIVQCQPDEVEHLSEALENTGALAVTLTDRHDDPILEPQPGTMPLWPQVVIEALYAEELTAIEAKNLLSGDNPHLQINLNTVVEQDWERVWMEDFKPMRFGKRLWICPSWLTPPEPEAVNLILDPGLAFGTGTHATTGLCLEWLDQATLTGKRLIDYGCGSGILALAAIKLGASQVCAVDIDPQALEATRNNATVNHIDNTALSIDFPASLSAPVDILLANILLAPLMTLKQDFHALLEAHGTLVVSGILTEQIPELTTAYQDHFLLQHSHHRDGWSLLEFKAC